MAYLAAAEVNKSIDFAGLRIYGLLTDLVQFKFYSYEPTTCQFCFDEIIYVNVKRTDALLVACTFCHGSYSELTCFAFSVQ